MEAKLRIQMLREQKLGGNAIGFVACSIPSEEIRGKCNTVQYIGLLLALSRHK